LEEELKHCKKVIKEIKDKKQNLVEQARLLITPEEAKELILTRWHTVLHETINGYLNNHSRHLLIAVEQLHVKYTTPLHSILFEREKETQLLKTKQNEQDELLTNMKSQKGNTQFLNTIDSLYKIRLENAQKNLILGRFSVDCGSFNAALSIVLLKEMYPKAPKKTDTLFWNKWKAELSKKLKGQYQILNPKLEELTIAELVKRANGTPSIQIKGLKKIKNPQKWA
jgi:hypothetical protein